MVYRERVSLDEFNKMLVFMLQYVYFSIRGYLNVIHQYLKLLYDRFQTVGYAIVCAPLGTTRHQKVSKL